MHPFHFLFVVLAASGVQAAPNFVVENAVPLLENASDHTRVATVTVSLSPHSSLVGDPVILNASPTVHPFALSRRSSHRWDLFITGVPKLDFEAVSLYSLTIYGKDNHGATTSQTIFIQIEDVNEPPVFIGSLAQEDQVTEIYITEDTAHGTIIYKTSAKDPEDAVLETVLVSFLGRSVSSRPLSFPYEPGIIMPVFALKYFISPESSGFTIDSTGAISTATALDFERGMRSFSLVIKVVDPGGLFATGNLKIFLINVNNKDPTLACSLFSIENGVSSVTSTNSTLYHEVNITLDEEIPVGKMIAMCQAADEDNLGDLTFQLDTVDDYFAVDKEKGVVVTTSRLDVEKTGFASALFFSIKACDGDQRCTAIPVATYVRGINDNPPFCDQYLIRYTGKEKIAKDTVVAKLSCNDLDKPPDTIHYSPSFGPVGSGHLFEQVSNAKNFIQVSLYDGLCDNGLVSWHWKELKPTPLLEGQTFYWQSIKMSMTEGDLFSHYVVIDYQVSSCSLLILSLSATRPPHQGEVVRYGAPESMSESVPALHIIKKLWYIYTMEYCSAIKNNEIPTFVDKWMELEMIIRMLFYKVTKELDYESPEVVAAGHIYEMMISVFDDLHPSHTVTVTILVEIAPENDFSPKFQTSHYAFSVPETSGAFYKVGQVTAVDEDHPPNCLMYKIINGDSQAARRFWIHPLSGMIELTTQPDYETVRQYNLTVEAVDCDRAHPRTAVTTVTVDIEDENDEAPVCIPYLYTATIPDNVVAGTNVNGLKLNCHDRDSQDFEMRFEMASGNENLHFQLDPSRGSNTPKLIVKNPFNFESGADLRQQYHLVVHVLDDNLKHGKAIKPRTGTAVIDIYVIRTSTPPPPTSSEQRKGLTIVYTAINTYKNSDWYIPFIFTLMAIFLAGLLSWMCFLLWRCGNIKNCSQKMTKEVSKSQPKGIKYVVEDRNQKEKNIITETRNKKLEVLTETTVYETVFDGEAIDPVSGNIYVYNSRTGARKWKTLGHQEESFGNMYSLTEVCPLEESTAVKTPINNSSSE